MSKGKYSIGMDLPCYMFDCGANLRPASFMDIAQELAAADSERIGCSDAVLAGNGLVWILSRMLVRFPRMPRRLDSVSAETWHRGADGPFFLRDTRLLNASGDVAVAASASWIIMDIETRRAVHGERLSALVDTAANCEERALGCDSSRIVVRNLELRRIGEHRVVYSDLDYNGHANNAKYTVWSMDCLPESVIRDYVLGSIEINFNHEVKPGALVTLLSDVPEDGCVDGRDVVVVGECDGVQAFVCRMEFERKTI
ncbi:MAG: thioesterase [Bacteroidales bacterium]|nr:thioesterase [Bacteroidales bacterium]